MPRIHPHAVAQIVRYPNGSHSDPFIAPWSKAHMARFARRLVEGTWPEKFPGEPHRDTHVWTDEVIRDVMAYRNAHDDFYSGSAHLACAHDGKFWATMRLWCRQVRLNDWQPGDLTRTMVGGALEARDRVLTSGEAALLFHDDDESGFHRLGAIGIKDPIQAIGRTALDLSRSIEEWEVA